MTIETTKDKIEEILRHFDYVYDSNGIYICDFSNAISPMYCNEILSRELFIFFGHKYITLIFHALFNTTMYYIIPKDRIKNGYIIITNNVIENVKVGIVENGSILYGGNSSEVLDLIDKSSGEKVELAISVEFKEYFISTANLYLILNETLS